MSDQNRMSAISKINPELWTAAMESEYFEDYLTSGGSAVKFISGNDETLSTAVHQLKQLTQKLNYHLAILDPSQLDANNKKPDLHRIEKFFFQVTSEVDWKNWAAENAKEYLKRQGLFIRSDRALNDIDGIAKDNNRDVTDLITSFQTGFATPLIKDHNLSIEFRSALTALSRAQIISESMTPTKEEVLLSWLQGTRIGGDLAALKSILIYSRIDRTNARHILTSFCRWLPRTGRSGLVVILDFRPYDAKKTSKAQKEKSVLKRLHEARARGAGIEELNTILDENTTDESIYYSDQAYLQMLQLLRMFIDDTEVFQGFCLVVLTSPSFYVKSTEVRNFYDYDALQTRIGLEVRDINKANPSAALVHLEATV